jgi:hypothetical protein
MWLVTGPGTRKARNLAAHPLCTLSCRRTAFGVATAEPHGAARWRFDT